jgi:hypothetical protein
MVTPRYFDFPFAVDGDLLTIPDTVQGDGSVSYPQGYGILYSTPVVSGGYDFPRASHNQLMYDITNALQWWENYAYPPYFSSVTYALNATVLYTDGNVYVSLKNSNTDLPTVTTSWRLMTGSSSLIGSTRNLQCNISSASSTAIFTADEIIVGSILGGPTINLGSFSQAVNLAGTPGIGAMDTGSPPNNGFVAIYAAVEPSGTQGAFACNVTTSSGSIYSGAHLPTGYANPTLIAIIPTNGSGQFIPCNLQGRQFYFGATQVLSGGSASSYTSISLSSVIPGAATTVSGYAVTHSGSLALSLAGNSSGIGQVNFAAPAGGVNGTFYGLPVLITQEIFYVVGSGTTGDVFISGYTF